MLIKTKPKINELKQKKGSVDIIILNYNRENFIDRAIRSAIDQQISIDRNSKVIVIDDASKDDSLKKIYYYIDKIEIFSSKKNKGVGYLSNYSLSLTNNQYWIRVDSDDFISSNAIELMCSILDHNQNYDFVYSDHFRIDDFGMKIEEVKLDTFDKLKNHGAGILFRKKILKSIGGFKKELREYEDANLIERLISKGHIGFYLPIPLYRYHIHGDNISLKGNREKYKRISEKMTTK